MSYKAGWKFHAVPNARYADTISLTIRYPVFNSNTEHAPDYSEWVLPVPTMEFWIQLADCTTDLDFYGKVLACLLDIERHEAREFFGVNGDKFDKLYHPHTVEGMTNWANRKPIVEAEDMKLGVLVHA